MLWRDGRSAGLDGGEEKFSEEAMEGCRGERGADSSAPLAVPFCSVSR
jgi:hypothetical protein